MDKATPAPIMTTDTDKASDKLVEMLRASGAETCNSAGTLFMVSLKDAVAFRDRIIASLCGDVEPVAWGIFANNGNIRFWACDKASADSQAAKTGGDVEGIYPASTVAALKAENEALRDAAQVLSDFAQTAPGRLPERVTNAIAAIKKGQS